jgi:hypothetical protein
MRFLVLLASLLASPWSAGKNFAKKPSPQEEEPRSMPSDQERPRALSYTEMMNSGHQRLVRTPKGDDWYLS